MNHYRVTIDSLVDTIEASDESEAIRAVRFKHGILTSVVQSAEVCEAPVVEESEDKPKKPRKKA